jgi:hypothetical protein
MGTERFSALLSLSSSCYIPAARRTIDLAFVKKRGGGCCGLDASFLASLSLAGGV